MAPGVFVDAWGWIALGHRRESRHQEIKNFYKDLVKTKVRVYTSDYILDEVATLLFRRESFHEAFRFVNGILTAGELGH